MLLKKWIFDETKSIYNTAGVENKSFIFIVLCHFDLLFECSENCQCDNSPQYKTPFKQMINLYLKLRFILACPPNLSYAEIFVVAAIY